MEIWKDIKGYEGYYQVSNIGRVKSVEKTVMRVNNGTLCKTNIKERFLKPENLWNKRLRVTLVKNKTNKRFSIHRLVAFAFIPPIEGKLNINHKDGNPHNNHVENLEWCTYKENMQHAIKNGLVKIHGEQNPNAKLKNQEVEEIKEKLKSGQYTHKKLSTEYKISESTISKIRRGLWGM